jgi:hypothetical protein
LSHLTRRNNRLFIKTKTFTWFDVVDVEQVSEMEDRELVEVDEIMSEL